MVWNANNPEGIAQTSPGLQRVEGCYPGNGTLKKSPPFSPRLGCPQRKTLFAAADNPNRGAVNGAPSHAELEKGGSPRARAGTFGAHFHLKKRLPLATPDGVERQQS